MADGDMKLEKIIHGLAKIQGNVKPGMLSKVVGITEEMKSLPLPPSYVEGIKVELLTMLGMGRVADTTSVYLSFYGIDRAEYLKIGIARNVRSRMQGATTDNPVPRLWTFEAVFASRSDALMVESALLRHMSTDKVHGEWVYVKGLSEQATEAVVASLAEVAAEAFGSAIQFCRTRV
jgi:hypothetical protein